MSTKRASILATNRRGFYSIFGETLFTAIGIKLSLSEHILVWFLGQIIIAITMFQWFVILHSCGHDSQFKSPTLNIIFGHFASLFCLIPYYPWVFIHIKHHLWSGWIDKDPSMRGLSRRPTGWAKSAIDFCWKFWIPVLSLSFALTVFWNPKQVDKSLSTRKQKILTRLSILFIVFVYAIVFSFTGAIFFKVMAGSIFLYMFMSDPILLSQHTYLPHLQSKKQVVRPILRADQGHYARSITFPKWVARFGMLNYGLHSTHHAHPRVPHYFLHTIHFKAPHEMTFIEWIRLAKSMKGTHLLYENSVVEEKTS